MSIIVVTWVLVGEFPVHSSLCHLSRHQDYGEEGDTGEGDHYAKAW